MLCRLDRNCAYKTASGCDLRARLLLRVNESDNTFGYESAMAFPTCGRTVDQRLPVKTQVKKSISGLLASLDSVEASSPRSPLFGFRTSTLRGLDVSSILRDADSRVVGPARVLVRHRAAGSAP